MKLGIIGGVTAVLLIVVLFIAYGSLFSVSQTHQALVVRLGKVVEVVTEPGLHVKYPLIETIVSIDKRILDLETPAQEIIASDQKRLVVDAFARYRIANALRFYQTVGSVEGVNARLQTMMNSALRRVLGEATFIELVRDQREELMRRIQVQLDREAAALGIEVVDVRIRRADLPEQNSQAVYKRMQTERQREAAEFRATGSQRAQEIRAKADRDVTVIVAEATAKAEQVRGQGDAERNRIYADAYNRDRDFFAFYRSMQAYEASMHGNDTRMLLKPDSNFFRYFGNPAGTGEGTPPTAVGTPPRPGAGASSGARTSGAGTQAPSVSAPAQPAPAAPQ